MDPSNNNSFGSFSNNAGAGNGTSVGSGAGVGSGAAITSPNTSSTTSSGAIVSGGATAVNNYSSKNFPDGGITIGGGEKRSRKGLIIAGVVFFVLAIGGGLAALAAMNGVFGGGSNGNGGNNNGSSIVIDDSVSMEVAFNRYANYLVSGEVKDEVVDDSVFNSEITFDSKYDDGLYINNVKSLFDIFYNKFGNIDKQLVPETIHISQLNDRIEFLVERSNTVELNTEELFEVFHSEGRSAAERYLQSVYSLSDDGNPTTRVWMDYGVSEGIVLLDYWELYQSYGCVSDGRIDANCVDSIPELEKSELAMKLGESRAGKKDVIINAKDIIKKQTALLNDYVEGAR